MLGTVVMLFCVQCEILHTIQQSDKCTTTIPVKIVLAARGMWVAPRPNSDRCSSDRRYPELGFPDQFMEMLLSRPVHRDIFGGSPALQIDCFFQTAHKVMSQWCCLAWALSAKNQKHTTLAYHLRLKRVHYKIGNVS